MDCTVISKVSLVVFKTHLWLVVDSERVMWNTFNSTILLESNRKISFKKYLVSYKQKGWNSVALPPNVNTAQSTVYLVYQQHISRLRFFPESNHIHALNICITRCNHNLFFCEIVFCSFTFPGLLDLTNTLRMSPDTVQHTETQIFLTALVYWMN